ncbi:MAG: hypothetical protein AAF614_14360 [Chloroflexota bacterium]
MSYPDKVTALAEDAEQLEQVYQEAVAAGETAVFKQAIDAHYEALPDNLLYAAWFHRLKDAAVQAKGFAIAWAWVVPLAVANGLLFWWLSDFERFMIYMERNVQGVTNEFLPMLILLAAPLSAAFVLVYFTAVSHAKTRQRWLTTVSISFILAAAVAYVFFTYPQTGTRPFQEQYLTLMVLHLPLLAWASVGAYLTFEHRDPANRFAFLIKSLEVFIMAGLLAIAGGLFTAITTGLFAVLGVEFSELVQRLFFAGGGGLIPVVATAVIYNPTVPPAKQAFDEGLSKLIGLLMRLMLPLTLLVLLIYLGFIPFNFWEPFDNREVLIIYNAMLFAVMALLVGATPLRQADLSPTMALWLRRGIVAVAALALITSLYALAAIAYRTSQGSLTPNRLTFIGWNMINIYLLTLLLPRTGNWLDGLHRAYRAGTAVYALWTLFVILAIPWLFGIDRHEVENLPTSVQNIIYEYDDPILLKCRNSPHIYLIESGKKRWLNNMDTFREQGYIWQDVRHVSCDDLEQIPDGVPIPLDAGTPPET